MERYKRPVDERIPFFWRQEFKRFTGVEPLYEEYTRNPDLWKKKPKLVYSAKIIIIFVLGCMLFVYLLLHLKEKKKEMYKNVQIEFQNGYNNKRFKP